MAWARRRSGRIWPRAIGALFVLLFIVGLAWPQNLMIPVQGADENDWNHQTFWYYPWGASGVHHGIDIFADEGAPVLAATSGLVLYSGSLSWGGEVLAILGPKWRVHYYAHLSRKDVSAGSWVWRGAVIGAVGRTGNAANRPAHLHYSIVTPIPHFWLDLSGPYGWRKMFFLDPGALLLAR